jgi:hypothetical protein
MESPESVAFRQHMEHERESDCAPPPVAAVEADKLALAVWVQGDRVLVGLAPSGEKTPGLAIRLPIAEAEQMLAALRGAIARAKANEEP